MKKTKKTFKTLKELKKKKTKTKTKPKAERKDPRIEEIYEEVVYFDCPVRGRVAQKVKIKRYKSLSDQMNQTHVLDSKDLLDQFETQDDGLSIYNNGDDLGVTGENE